LFTLIALASAYTAFADDGSRVVPTLAVIKPGDPARRAAVFSPATAAAMRAMLRQAVEEGTGARAAAPGLDIAGKTGTSEKLLPDGRYDPDRNLALFAAMFPGYAPRYVMIVALDEPQRTPASGGLATGGAVAAPTAGRIAARIAPFLDLDAAKIAADLANRAKP
jgi:cell division protein FtsI (penicillin-binding protein 3)